MKEATSAFVRRVLIVLALAALAVMLYQVVHAVFRILLVIFGGVLLAVLIDGVARWLRDRLPLSRTAAVGVVLALVISLAAVAGWQLGPRVAEQAATLSDRLPQVVSDVKSWLQQSSWGTTIAQRMPDSLSAAMPDGVPLDALTTAFSTVFGALPTLFIIVFVGVYVAFSPHLYVNALVRLVPKGHRPRARQVTDALGNGLRLWLLGRISSMTVVGVLTAIGLMVFGVPLALTLALLAALLCFVPYIGPILAFVPALAVAVGEGTQTMLAVAGVYLGVQFAESYLITPLIQKRTVSMPPALLITSQVLLGVLAGAMGVAVATPLVVMVVILVQMLYLQDVLRDDVTVMGSGGGSSPS